VFVSRRTFAAHCHVSPDLRSADSNVPNKLTRWPISIYEYMPWRLCEITLAVVIFRLRSNSIQRPFWVHSVFAVWSY
jgi:hypothetical protein